jgi:hypothetical protein
LQVAPGVEINVEAGTAGFSPEELRIFFRKVQSAYQEAKFPTSNDNKGHDDE